MKKRVDLYPDCEGTIRFIGILTVLFIVYVACMIIWAVLQ